MGNNFKVQLTACHHALLSTFRTEDDELTLIVSPIPQDPIQALVFQLVRFALSQQEMTVVWFAEPQEYQLTATVAGENVTFIIGEVRRIKHESVHNRLFSANVPMSAFLRAFWRALRNFEAQEATRTMWDFSVPSKEIQMIKQALT